MFKIPLVRPEQHSRDWEEEHWDPVSPVGTAATAPKVARNTMAEMNCILKVVYRKILRIELKFVR